MKKALLIGLFGFLFWNPVHALAAETPVTDSIKAEAPAPRPAPLPAEKPEKPAVKELKDALKEALKGGDEDEGEEAIEKAVAQSIAQRSEHHDRSPGLAMVETLIPITAIVGFFGTIILAIVVPLVIGHRRRNREIELQKLALEKGVTVIPEVPQAEPVRPKNDKRTGVLLIGVGLAMVAPGLAMAEWELAALGLAPVFLGLMYIVSGKWFPPETK